MIKSYKRRADVVAFDVVCECGLCGREFEVAAAIYPGMEWRQEQTLSMLHLAVCDRCVERLKEEEKAERLKLAKKAEEWHEVVMGRAPAPGAEPEHSAEDAPLVTFRADIDG